LPNARRGLLGQFRCVALGSTLLLVLMEAETSPGADLTRPRSPVELHAQLSAGGPVPNRNPHLVYYGGKVLSNVKLIMVLYGTGTYDSHISNDTAPSMASFYQELVNSSYLDWLCEYSTPTQTIGRGTYGGKITIVPAAANNGSVIDDVNIQAELVRQINLGQLPAPDANTVYMVHFPKEKTITSRTYRSCVDFCGYHSTVLTGSIEIFYAVLPDMSPSSPCTGGCGASPVAFNNQCSVASHEIIEAITDPEVGLATIYGPPLGWYDAIYGEIADICQTGGETAFVGTDGFTNTVQRGFSNAHGCIASPLTPVALSQTVTNLQERSIFIRLSGSDPNVCAHPLSYSITANPPHGQLTGVPPVLTYTPAPGYFGTDSFQFMVNNGTASSAPSAVNIIDVPNYVSIARLSDQNIRVSFATVTGWTYKVTAADSPTAPGPWPALISTNAGTNTMLSFDDLTATNHPQRLYRPVTP